MLNGQKLTTKGLLIYYSGILIAVAVLVYISIQYRELSKIISFLIFAGIWTTSFLIALKFKNEE